MPEYVSRRQRKELIRREWIDRGRSLWDPKLHGQGLKPLVLPAPAPGAADLEYWFAKVTLGDRTIDAVVCDGVLVAIVRDGQIAETILA